MNYEEYLDRMKNNELVWVKQDSKVTWLLFWKHSLECESCGEPTHLTSCQYDFVWSEAGNVATAVPFQHPICEKCYEELHAYHIVVGSEPATEKVEREV